VNRVALAAVPLFLAGCGTSLYGQAPHPYRPAVAEPRSSDCPITASRDWTAWVNAMPGPNAGPRLVVSGKVATATGGYHVGFDPDLQIRESYPAQASVTLRVADPETDNNTQAVVTHEVRWDWPLGQPVGSVTIRCGDKTLAQIEKVQTAW